MQSRRRSATTSTMVRRKLSTRSRQSRQLGSPTITVFRQSTKQYYFEVDMFYKTDYGNVDARIAAAFRLGRLGVKVEEGAFTLPEEFDAYARGDAELNANGPSDELNEQH